MTGRLRKAAGIGLIATGLTWAFAMQMCSAPRGVEAAAWAQTAQSGSEDATPQFQNARVEKRAVRGTLGDEVRAWTRETKTARWLGYSVAEVQGERMVCCGNWDNSRRGCGTCRLEGNHSGVNINSTDAERGTVHLEGGRRIAVLYRAENGKLSRIQVVSTGCTVDGGGRDVVWLEGVKDSESVAVLAGIITAGNSRRDEEESLGNGALTAVALHADGSAEQALESFVEPRQAERLRKETAFWLGEARGAAGFRTLQQMAHNDASAEVREQVTFALSVSKEPGAVNEMIRMAHDDKNSEVRGQALFWLAQKAGTKAVGTIDGAIENDPDTEVKKKAVFALSQLPTEEGVPKLIEVAQNNKNPEVRKQAIFWLGQSEDPRALAFFEKVLAN